MRYSPIQDGADGRLCRPLVCLVSYYFPYCGFGISPPQRGHLYSRIFLLHDAQSDSGTGVPQDGQVSMGRIIVVSGFKPCQANSIQGGGTAPRTCRKRSPGEHGERISPIQPPFGKRGAKADLRFAKAPRFWADFPPVRRARSRNSFPHVQGSGGRANFPRATPSLRGAGVWIRTTAPIVGLRFVPRRCGCLAGHSPHVGKPLGLLP